MIVLDTNVVSEPLRQAPAECVVTWLDAQHLETLYLTSVTVAELRLGVAVLPEGRRRTTLHRRLEEETIPLFAGRVLPFDESVTGAYAQVQADARAQGRPLGTMDALIAAICAAHGLALATRNVKDFAHTGVRIIDPWTR